MAIVLWPMPVSQVIETSVMRLRLFATSSASISKRIRGEKIRLYSSAFSKRLGTFSMVFMSFLGFEMISYMVACGFVFHKLSSVWISFWETGIVN